MMSAKPFAELPQDPAERAAWLSRTVINTFEERIRFNAVLGIRVESLNPSEPVLGFAMRPELVGHFVHGQLHGGVIATALDSAAGLAVMLAFIERHRDAAPEQVFARLARTHTVDLRIDYLEKGLGERFAASARVLRMGERTASIQMRLENEHHTLIATGSAVFAVG
jgi:uncharacterized protein (TIGR00369 family)